MQTHKRKIVRLLLVCLLSILIPCSAFAAGTVIEVKAPTNMPKAGDTFTVTVNISGNPGFSAMQFTLGFDTSVMQCQTAEIGETFSSADMYLANTDYANGVPTALISINELNTNGVVWTFQMKALQDVSKMDFTLSELLVGDADSNDIPFSVTGAKLITDTPSEPTQPTEPTTPSEPTTPTEPTTPEDPTKPTTPTGGEDTPGVIVIGPTEVSFTDTVGHWAASYIERAVQLKIFGGYGNGIFKPDQPISRAQFITVLYRIAGSPEIEINTPFKDIDSQSLEFKKAISWGYANKYINGTSQTTFDPEKYITRQEAMKMLFGYSGGQSGQELILTRVYNSSFTDSASIASWAKPAMYWGYYNKIISGTTATTLGPEGNATRAQIAKILVGYLESYSK